MSKLTWDKVGERFYETGLDHGVLYPMEDGKYPKGVAWNGLTAVNENPSGAESNPVYADNIKYLNLLSAEDFGATIEAYTYPEEFEECDGSAEIAPGITIGQQARKIFGMAYRTKIGNDTDGQEHGYKLHLIYSAQASPSAKNRQTINESPGAVALSWEVTTTPVDVPGFKPTAHLTIDSTRTDPRRMRMLEDILFGTDKEDPRLPMPEEIITMMKEPLPTEGTVSVPADETQYYSKPVSELQTNVAINGTKITGTLNYVADYSGFSKDKAKQSGNYLALAMSATNDGTITVQLLNGMGEPKEVKDGYLVVRITNPKTQKLSVVFSKEDYTDSVEYDLSGLTCKTQA